LNNNQFKTVNEMRAEWGFAPIESGPALLFQEADLTAEGQLDAVAAEILAVPANLNAGVGVSGYVYDEGGVQKGNEDKIEISDDYPEVEECALNIDRELGIE